MCNQINNCDKLYIFTNNNDSTVNNKNEHESQNDNISDSRESITIDKHDTSDNKSKEKINLQDDTNSLDEINNNHNESNITNELTT